MSTYDTLESSRQDSRPVELYAFAIGSRSYLYTSAEDAITIGADTYEPEAIARDAIEAGGSENANRTLVVTLPASNAFAALYVNVVPGQSATVSIFRVQRDETPSLGTTQILQFKGTVQAVRFPNDGQTAEIALRSIEASSSQQIPRRSYMSLCGHVLYDQRCKVDPALFSVTGVVASATGNVITLTGADAYPDQYFRGGYCKPSTESDFRMVLDHTGNLLTLLLPFATDPVGSNVVAYAGCNRSLTGDCATKFDAVLEFGGFAFVPTKNPFATGLN